MADAPDAEVHLRRATASDGQPLADVWWRARDASIPAIPPPVHPRDEVTEWFATVVLPTCEVWLIEAGTAVVALMVLDADELEQLYVDPDWTSRGLGSLLIDHAKNERSTLELWTFATNPDARRFYERHGFVMVAPGEADNEEQSPDIRYRWRRDQTVPDPADG